MLVSTIEEIDDDLYYLSDILSASVSDLSRLVTQTFLHAWVFPMLLPSFVSYENYKLVLASLSLLVLLLENKEIKKSLLKVLGILPPKMQCQKLSEVFDSLIGLLSSRPPHGEAMWHVSWLFKSILPYLERKRFDHHLKVSYENASFIILNEINDSCCGLILKALLAEWKDCKRALEISALHKHIRFLLLPDSQAVLSNGSCSSFIVKERMLGVVQVFVLFHQVVNLMLRGTFPEIPPLDLIKEFPTR